MSIMLSELKFYNKLAAAAIEMDKASNNISKKDEVLRLEIANSVENCHKQNHKKRVKRKHHTNAKNVIQTIEVTKKPITDQTRGSSSTQINRPITKKSTIPITPQTTVRIKTQTTGPITRNLGRTTTSIPGYEAPSQQLGTSLSEATK